MASKANICVLSLLAAAVAAWPATEDKAPPKQPGSVTMTDDLAVSILDELRQIRLELEKLVKLQPAPQPQAAPAPPRIATAKLTPDIPVLGDRKASLMMIEFIDLQCPYCKKFEEGAFAEIRKNLIDTGKVRYYSRDFPLEMHSSATKAAIAAHCAAEQGKFWPFRGLLMSAGADVSPNAIASYAKASGINADALNSCLSSSRYEEAIRASVADAAAMGVQGTPTFLIGKSTAEGTTGTLVVGALPYASFEAEINRLLSK